MISDYENTKQKKGLIQFLDLIGSNIVKSRYQNIEEEYSVFRDDEEDCEFNRGYDTVFCFTIDKKEKTIEEYQMDMEEYTISLFQKAFHKPVVASAVS